MGYDEFGKKLFDTHRSPLGELLYKFKYQRDWDVLEDIVRAAVRFVKVDWGIGTSLHGVLPIPPSKTREFQPVIEIAKRLSRRLEVPFYGDVVKKLKTTPQLKDIEWDQRVSLLKDAFSVGAGVLKGKNVLLLDDLYEFGTTLSAVSRVLREDGKAESVYVLALTKTRVGL